MANAVVFSDQKKKRADEVYGWYRQMMDKSIFEHLRTHPVLTSDELCNLVKTSIVAFTIEHHEQHNLSDSDYNGLFANSVTESAHLFRTGRKHYANSQMYAIAYYGFLPLELCLIVVSYC